MTPPEPGSGDSAPPEGEEKILLEQYKTCRLQVEKYSNRALECERIAATSLALITGFALYRFDLDMEEQRSVASFLSLLSPVLVFFLALRAKEYRRSLKNRALYCARIEAKFLGDWNFDSLEVFVSSQREKDGPFTERSSYTLFWALFIVALAVSLVIVNKTFPFFVLVLIIFGSVFFFLNKLAPIRDVYAEFKRLSVLQSGKTAPPAEPRRNEESD